MTWSLPLTGTNNPSPQEFAEVRDWNKLLPNSMTLKNAFVNRKPKDGEEVTKVPQSFTYLCRSGRFESQAIQFSKYEWWSHTTSKFLTLPKAWYPARHSWTSPNRRTASSAFETSWAVPGCFCFGQKPNGGHTLVSAPPACPPGIFDPWDRELFQCCKFNHWSDPTNFGTWKVWRVAKVVCCISAGLQPFEPCCKVLHGFGKSKSISISIFQFGVCGRRTFRPFEVRGAPAWGQTAPTKATAFAGGLSPSLGARRGGMHLKTIVLSRPMPSPFAIQWIQGAMSIAQLLCLLGNSICSNKGLVPARAAIGCHGWVWWKFHFGQNLCPLWWRHILRKTIGCLMFILHSCHVCWAQVKRMMRVSSRHCFTCFTTHAFSGGWEGKFRGICQQSLRGTFKVGTGLEPKIDHAPDLNATRHRPWNSLSPTASILMGVGSQRPPWCRSQAWRSSGSLCPLLTSQRMQRTDARGWEKFGYIGVLAKKALCLEMFGYTFKEAWGLDKFGYIWAPKKHRGLDNLPKDNGNYFHYVHGKLHSPLQYTRPTWASRCTSKSLFTQAMWVPGRA